MLSITETDKIKEIIAEQFGVDVKEITNETSFINDLRADSLDTVELVMRVEDVFKEEEGLEIKIFDEDVERITTVGKMFEYIEEKKRG